MKFLQLKKYISANIRISFSRSSGPGGQNVNKLNTKVTARLNISNMTILSDEQKERIFSQLKSRINENGDLVVHVQDERSQGRNKALAVIRILQLIKTSLKKQKRRVPTKPSVQADEKRLKEKKKRSEIKKLRKMQQEHT